MAESSVMFGWKIDLPVAVAYFRAHAETIKDRLRSEFIYSTLQPGVSITEAALAELTVEYEKDLDYLFSDKSQDVDFVDQIGFDLASCNGFPFVLDEINQEYIFGCLIDENIGPQGTLALFNIFGSPG